MPLQAVRLVAGHIRVLARFLERRAAAWAARNGEQRTPALVEVDMLTALNPLSLSVDLRVGLNCGHHCRGSDFHFARLLDDLLQCCPYVALALLK
jgi:hypothetical protein